MSLKIKFMAAGAILLGLCGFIYFTLRFTVIEQGYVDSLVQTTNGIVRMYGDLEKKMSGENRKPGRENLSIFLQYVHGRHPDIALLAVTDSGLSLRLSSKNDRYIRSTDLFESILSEFMQNRYNINKSKPYIVRYYTDKSGRSAEQVKFYIFLSKIGEYRLLAVYPYLFADRILLRTGLELALIVVFIVIITAAGYIAASGASRKQGGPAVNRGPSPIDLALIGSSLSREGRMVTRETSNVVAETLAGYVHDLFRDIQARYGADSISLYLCHSSGRLVKTIELKGRTFFKIDSISFDTIDIDNELGLELRKGATTVLDDGRKIIIPLIYNNIFLGTVNIERQGGFSGSEIGDIKTGLVVLLKNVHDFIIVNDVMNDADTGLNSKLYCNLKYNECLKNSRGRGRDFSVLMIRLFDDAAALPSPERNQVIKLLAPSIADIVGSDGYLCRYDSHLAVILPEADSVTARKMAADIRASLSRYRVKIDDSMTLQITPAVGFSSTDSAGVGEDILAAAITGIAGQGRVDA